MVKMPMSCDSTLRFGDPGHLPPPDGEAPRRERQDEQSGSVLVVDDEKDARDAIVELLEYEGYPAVGAADGAEALELLERGLRPALMMVDLRMPVMDGWDFCRAVAADPRFAEIPIAIVTASASVDRLPERRRSAGLFVKPVQVSRLLATVRALCG